MTREFLKNLGVEDAAVDKILDENMADIGKEKRKTDAAEAKLATAKTDLETANSNLTAVNTELETLKKSSGDVAAVQKLYDELKAQYDTDTADLKGQLADRDYSDGIAAFISKNGLKFSSKGAEQNFIAEFKKKKFEQKDGAFVGADDFLKELQESDPGAFASNKPIPRIVGPTGNGGAPRQAPSRAAQLAAKYNENLYGKAKESD